MKHDELSDDQKLSIRKALKLVRESKDIKGTVAEKYLKEARGIEEDKWSKDVRFHEGVYSKLNGGKNPAVLFIARDKDDKVQSVQAVYLDKNSGKKVDVEVQKQTFGTIKGALFNASANSESAKTAIICEGPEDALSISKAIKNDDVYACFGKGNFNNLSLDKLDKHQRIILALDNDGKRISEMSDIANVATKLSEAGKEVFLVQPQNIKQDYNDILKSKGSNEVASLILSGKKFENDSSYKDVVNSVAKEKTPEKEI